MIKHIPLEHYSKYIICSNGDIISKFTGKPLKQTLSNTGYLVVCLTDDNGKRTTMSVHRLVAQAFLGKSNLPVNHIDENKLNNDIENLEYTTTKDNNNHGTRNARISKTHSRPIYCKETNKIYQSTKQACHELNLHTSNVCEVLKGCRKQTGGYHFEYTK